VLSRSVARQISRIAAQSRNKNQQSPRSGMKLAKTSFSNNCLIADMATYSFGEDQQMPHLTPLVFTTTLMAMLGLGATAIPAETALKSAVDGNAPPFAMPTLAGETEGLTIDMTREIARRLGREISIEAMPFSGLIPALQAGTFDFLSVPMTATEERSQSMLLSEGIWAADYGFLLAKGGAQFSDLSQLQGKTLAVNKGTVYDQWARDHATEYGWTVESYGSINDSAQAVQARRADATLLGQSSALMIARKNPALMAADLVVSSGKYYAYTFPIGSEPLRVEVEKAIECIKADGTAAKLYQEWLGITPAEGALEVTPQPGIGAVGLGNYDPAPHEISCK
jgi:polar amino acid transport system substrate-binding protein